MISWLCAQYRVFLCCVYWVWHCCSYWSYLAVSIDLTEKNQTWTDFLWSFFTGYCEGLQKHFLCTIERTSWRKCWHVVLSVLSENRPDPCHPWQWASASHGLHPDIYHSQKEQKSTHQPFDFHLTFLLQVRFSPTFVRECWCDSEAQLVTSEHGKWDETFKMWHKISWVSKWHI